MHISSSDNTNHLWNVDNWYSYLMSVARNDAINDPEKRKYYPVDVFIRDKTKKRLLAQQRKKAYEALVIGHMASMRDDLKRPLFEKVQKKELFAVIVCIIILITTMFIGAAVMFYNYDRWDYKGLGAVVAAVGFFVILISSQYYLMGKLIRDAIMRICMNTG